jgi:hypothetical protein
VPDKAVEAGTHRCASAPVRWQGKGGPTAFVTGKDPAVVSSGRGLLLQAEGDEREEARPFGLSKNTQGGVSPRRGRWRRSGAISGGGNDFGCRWLRQKVLGQVAAIPWRVGAKRGESRKNSKAGACRGSARQSIGEVGKTVGAD